MAVVLADALQPLLPWASRVLAALLVLAVGLLVAYLAGRLTRLLAERLGLQRAGESGGLVRGLRQAGIRWTVPQILGLLVFWLLVALVLAVAFELLQLQAATTALERLVAYLPRLLVAMLIVALGLMLAAVLQGLVMAAAQQMGVPYAKPLAAACYWALALIVWLAAFDQLEIQFRLLNEALLIVLAGVALALGLSVGLGSRDVMAGLLAGYYVRQQMRPGDRVRVAGYEGVVREVGPVATIVETEEEGLLHRHSVPNVRMLNEAVR